MRRRLTLGALLLLLLLPLAAACGGTSPSGVAVSVDAAGQAIAIDGDRPLRALLLEVEWDTPGDVTFTLGADGERLNLLRRPTPAASDTSARLLLTDTRRVRLPKRGVLLQASAPIRIVSAEGADDGPVPGGAPVAVPVEVR